MLRFRPARLRERIGLIVLLHLLLMVAVFLAFTLGTAARNVPPYYRLPTPEKVRLIVTAFEQTPPATYPNLISAFSDRAQHVSLLERLPNTPSEGGTPTTFHRYQDALGGRPFRIEAFGGRGPASLEALPSISADPIRVSVQLPDGRAIAIEQMVTAPIVRILNNLLLFAVVIAVIDLGVVLWLASQTTRPVERLAHAVREDRLEGLQHGGPREIAELADTIIHLRARLRDLLEERTRMLAAIAHDYRTYLTRLQLRAEFIDDETQRQAAFGDLDEMRTMLGDTLSFARESATAEADEAVCDLGEELALIAEDRGARGQDVRIGTLSEPVFVRASHLSFQRMMANLLDNAVRYGGGQAQISIRSEAEHVRICVEDEGPGVPEASLGRLLEPFERLEQSRARHTGGVGLGLSIVQALAHRHDGELALENRAEGGFRAMLTLRLAEARPAR